MIIHKVPVGFVVHVRRADSKYVSVEARLQYLHTDGPFEGQTLPSLSNFIYAHPSQKYVSEPNRLERLFGATLEKRIAKASESVSEWATKEIRNYYRRKDICSMTHVKYDGAIR